MLVVLRLLLIYLMLMTEVLPLMTVIWCWWAGVAATSSGSGLVFCGNGDVTWYWYTDSVGDIWSRQREVQLMMVGFRQ